MLADRAEDSRLVCYLLSQLYRTGVISVYEYYRYLSNFASVRRAGCWRLILAMPVVLSALVASVALGQAETDIDSDGVIDKLDIDQDNDGIPNDHEGLQRLADLSNSRANYFSAVQTDAVSTAQSVSYDLIGTADGKAAALSGKVLSSDTVVEWSMQDGLPKFRNLAAGQSIVEWRALTNTLPYNFDLTISDLDGLRSETILVDDNAIAGYSLSLNSNVRVSHADKQFSFTGTGDGGSTDDQVTLHVRDSAAIVLTYQNTMPSGEQPHEGVSIAGYRHSLEPVFATFFQPVTQYRDSDADGVADHRDLDSDNDGLGDVAESGGTDEDRDNMIDGPVDGQGLSVLALSGLQQELLTVVYEGDITVSGDDPDQDGLLSSVDSLPDQFGGGFGGIDSDADGLDDLDEIRLFQTDPDSPDSDSDGLTDDAEIQVHNTNALTSDTDNDSLTDAEEVLQYGTNPNNADTDGDGTSDREEIEGGLDPLLAENIIVVLPAVQEPIMQPEMQPEIQPEIPQADQAAEMESIQPTSSEALELPALLMDDEIDDQNPVNADDNIFRTGLNGSPGCSMTSGSHLTSPFFPVLLLFAFAGLLVNSARRKRSAAYSCSTLCQAVSRE